MKNNQLFNLFVLAFTLIILISCKQKQTDELICLENNKRIEIFFEGGKDCLEFNEPTRANILTENINPSKLMIFGSGIRKIGDKNSEYKWEITAKKQYLANGRLKIGMEEIVENGENLKVEFFIKVKHDLTSVDKSEILKFSIYNSTNL